MTLGVLEGILLRMHDLGGIDPHIIGHAISGLIGAIASLLVNYANRQQQKRTQRRIYAVLRDMRTDLRRAQTVDQKEETPAVAEVVEEPVLEPELDYWHLVESLDQLEKELWEISDICRCGQTDYRNRFQ